MNLTGGITMLNEKNTVNWLRFIRDVLDDKECKQKINTFIKKHYHNNPKYTSHLIYNRYCK